MSDYAQLATSEFSDLINTANEESLIDWMTDALHAVVGVCLHSPGAVSNAVLEAIRYELTGDES